MYIYNITFNVDKNIEQEWLRYVKNVFIPKMLKSGLLTSARILKLMIDEPQGNSYAIQFETKNQKNLQSFLSDEFEAILQEIHQKFAPEMVYFATELDEIDRQGGEL